MSKIDAEIGVKTGALRTGLAQARAMVDGFKRSAGTAIGGAVSFATSPLVAGVTAAVGALSVGAGAFKAFNAAAQQETTATTFATLLGSADAAKKKLEELNQFSDVTPYEPEPVNDAARALLAFGIAADDIIPTLTRVGDVASGVNAPIGDIATIYGKARVAGTLFAEDINQLTERGIPVIQEFAKQLGVSEDQVKKMGSEGKIKFSNLEQAFVSLTSAGGKFAGMMDAQSRTTSGLMSTLQGKWNAIFREFGTPVNDALKPLLTGAIDLVTKLGPMAKRAGEATAAALDTARELFTSGQLWDVVATGLKVGFGKAVNFLMGGLQGAVTYATELFSNGGAMAGIEALGDRLAQMLLQAFDEPIRRFQAAVMFAAQAFTLGKGWEDKIKQAEELDARIARTRQGIEANAADMAAIRDRMAANVLPDGRLMLGYSERQLEADKAELARMAGNMEQDAKLLNLDIADRNKIGSAKTMQQFYEETPANMNGMTAAEWGERGDAAGKEFAVRSKAAMERAMSGFAPADMVSISGLEADQKRMMDEIEAARKAAEANREKRRAEAEAEEKRKAAEAVAAKGAGGPGGVTASGKPELVADAMARVGGGGNFARIGGVDPALRKMDEQTTELRAIRKGVEKFAPVGAEEEMV